MTQRDPEARIAQELSPELRRRALSLYVALGDSFTAGTGCVPGQAWPDLLAESLTAASPALEHRNLAVHGATSAELADQLPEALELEPDLVTIVFGANDALSRTRPDVAAYARRLAHILRSLRQANSQVRIVTATSPENWDFLGLGPRTSARVARAIAEINRATRAIAMTCRVACLDVAGHPGLSEPENFSADGLHPSPLGHRRAAQGFAELIAERFEIEIEIANQGGANG